jgi:hypothetical protein
MKGTKGIGDRPAGRIRVDELTNLRLVQNHHVCRQRVSERSRLGLARYFARADPMVAGSAMILATRLNARRL